MILRNVGNTVTKTNITDHGNMYGIKEFFDEVRKVSKELAKEGLNGDFPWQHRSAV